MTSPTSCESKRSSAYSDDLRWRIIWQREALNLKYSDIAVNLCVSESTVRRIVERFEASGDVSKNKYPSAAAFRKITEPAELYIMNLVLERPGIYLSEIAEELETNLGVEVTESAICKVLKKIGFSRQKLCMHALQRDEELRRIFSADVSLYPRQTLLFIDETGTDRRDSLRKCGYSIRGQPAVKSSLMIRGEHVTAIAAMSVDGIVALEIVRGGVDGDAFYNFVCRSLLSILMPFNGVNPNSVIILDNCAIHHVDEVQQVFTDCGVIAHYLPPYSPDFNPIELAFSKVKYMLKRLEKEMEAIDDIDTLLVAAFASITTSDCRMWINSCGLF